MKKKLVTGLATVLLIFGMFGVANASNVILLQDFRETNDTSDVVHLGDQNYSYLIVPAPQGHSITFDFNVPEELLNTNVTLTITQHYANPDSGYFDHIFINGEDLGFLSNATDTWITEQFQFSGSILNLEGNNLTINSGEVGSNYDDFEFTNLNLAPVPIPGAVWLLGSGIGCLVGTRIRRRKK